MPEGTDPYVDLYRSRRAQSANPPRQLPRGVSALEQDIIDHRDNMLRVSIMDAPAPEQIARETRVARAAGQPPAMIDDVDSAEKAVNANRLTQVFGRYPALGRWGATNLRGAATAQDDHEALGMLGKAWEVLKGRGEQAAQYAGVVGWSQMNTVNNLADTLTYPLDAALATGLNAVGLPSFDPDKQRERVSAKRQRMFQASQAAMDAADKRAQTGNYWIDATTSGAATMIPSMVGIAMSVASRNPNSALTFMGLSAAAPAYQSATPVRASAFGATL